MLHLLTALLLLRNWRPAKPSVPLPAAGEREVGGSEVTAAVGEPVGEYLRESSERASSAPSGVADDSLLPSENHEAIPCIERALPSH